MAADRGAYICQSQSLNIHIQDPNFGKLTSMHFYAWEKGLKTGMYYLRTKAAADAIKFTVEKQADVAIEHANVVHEHDLNYEAYAANAKASASTFNIPGLNNVTEQNWSAMQCSLDDPDGCEACGS